MAQLTIYHNPQCSKSCEAVALLESQGVSFQVIEYLKHSPSEQELRDLISLLDTPVSSLVRVKEKEYLASPFDVNSVDEVVRHLAQSPRLMERPVVVREDIAVIGRPVEKIKDLLKAGK